MLQVNLRINYDESSYQCLVSKDIIDELKHTDNQEETIYCQVEYTTCSAATKKVIVYCKQDNTLPFNHVSLKATILNLTPRDIYPMTSCNITKITPAVAIPALSQITLLFDAQLYGKLSQLSDKRDILTFISKKFNIEEHKTVVHSNTILSHQWCKIIETKPYYQGTLDPDKTKIVLVKDTEGLLESSLQTIPRKLELHYDQSITLPLKCLKHEIPNELLHQSNLDFKCIDNTSAVFVDQVVLKTLDAISGSYIEIRNKANEKRIIANIFPLITPHKYDPLALHITPRLKMQLKQEEEIIIQKCSLKPSDIPLAETVSLARVNGPYQNEKLYQNIIARELKDFFLKSTRLIKIGDLVPITFDSTLSLLPSASIQTAVLDIPKGHDSLVWFKVIEINPCDDLSSNARNASTDVQNSNDGLFYKVEYGKDLKLFTEGIVYEKFIPSNQCDVASYYNLPRVYRYDPAVFPYANKIVNIFNSIMECITRNFPVRSSILLHSTTRSTGKSTLVKWLCLEYGINLVILDCLQLLANSSPSSDSNHKILGTIKATISSHVNNSTVPIVIYFSHLEELFDKIDPNQDPIASKLSSSLETEFTNILDNFMKQNHNIIFVYSTNDIEKIPSKIRVKPNFEIEVNVPTEEQRRDIFKWCLSKKVLNFDTSSYGEGIKFIQGEDIDVSNLAIHSAGLTPLDIKSIVQNSKYISYKEMITRENATLILLFNNDTISIPMKFMKDAIDMARDEFSVSIGAPKIPNVTWDDIGGVDVIKGEIMDTIDMPLRHPELFSSGSKQRSGILFYGPPGTGKTLMAKAIASNFSLNFFSVKGPELLNMYIGESEANVRRVFQKAREAKPCVIFFDEIDSVAPKRGNQGDSGGVMDRIVSQLLAELDGMSGDGEGIFVIGATNRPDLLDEALLRPGRFDKLLYLGISNTNEKQYNILKALTRKFSLAQDTDLYKIAEMCPFTYTGADFYALCSDAMLNAMTRVARTVDKKLEQFNKDNNTHVSLRQWFDKTATQEDITVSVAMEDFFKAQSELVPSVSQEELDHYLQVKREFEG